MPKDLAKPWCGLSFPSGCGPSRPLLPYVNPIPLCQPPIPRNVPYSTDSGRRITLSFLSSFMSPLSPSALFKKTKQKKKKTSYQNFTTQLPSLNTSTLDPGSGPHWAFHSCLPRPLFPHLQIPGDTTSRYEQDRIPKLLPEGPLSFSPSPPPPLSATHWPAEALPARQSTAITLS